MAQLTVGLWLVCLSSFAAVGQIASAVNKEVRTVNATSSSPTVTDEKLRTLEDQLRQHDKTLNELRAIIAEQQRTIDTLLAKTTNPEAKVTEPNEIARAADAPTQPQASPLEDRVKKLEGKVLAIGPFRFSGDFRLRYDGIFRKADNATPTGFAPLMHVQNSRMRYRLRFNFDTDIDSRVSFHGQLSTGSINNPLTSDQDFGETTTHHPFFISEAWIDYHPNKGTQLQAGRLQEIFADNSRFLFD